MIRAKSEDYTGDKRHPAVLRQISDQEEGGISGCGEREQEKQIVCSHDPHELD
jgi:hypothetical protein